MREHTRIEIIAETLGTLLTLLLLWGGIYAVLWALSESAEAQQPSIHDTYTGIYSVDGEKVIPTPQGPCKQLYWSTYLGRCTQTLAPEELNTLVFHPKGGTWQEHHYHAAKHICRLEALVQYTAYMYFDWTAGPEHSHTQRAKYSYLVKQQECDNRFGVN